MPILATTLTSALTWLGEQALSAGAKFLSNRLRDRAAKDELAQLLSQSVEAAITVAPSLAEDLRSVSFVRRVVAPLILDRLNDPSADWSAKALAENYISTFVASWVRESDTDSTIAKIFQTDRATLASALAVFLTKFKAALSASEHWRDVSRDRMISEMHCGVAFLVEQERAARSGPELDLETARADARIGSQDLLEWQRTIEGLFLDRPELDRLIARITSDPRGRTLLVGGAGSGKSALLSELTERLQKQGVTVFGIKADMLPSDVRTSLDISRALGLQGDIQKELDQLARVEPVVLIIDQLDAVSDVMDQSSQRMKLILRIANSFKLNSEESNRPPVHILVSSRPFEAAHDARFQTLGAETITLSLPSLSAIESMLGELQIPISFAPESLKETLRRPFALRLFVDLMKRGESVTAVNGSELLNAWLRSAKLGDPSIRPQVLKLFARLADSMTRTETLWRPADEFDAAYGSLVAVGEAAGIIVRQSNRLGFSHQSWLDDFQAKTFTSGSDVAVFAHARQDGLFARATTLRALERLRPNDETEYHRAVDALLGDGQTRRHLRHLVVDFIASQDSPTKRELGWILSIFNTDVPLTRRAAGVIANHWQGWREAMLPTIPDVMRSAELRWTAIQLLKAEAAIDPGSAIRLLRQEWSDQSLDHDLFQAVWRAGVWDDWVCSRVTAILGRMKIQEFAIGSYIEHLIGAGNISGALELLAAFLSNAHHHVQHRLRLHGLPKLIAAEPAGAASVLVDWFIDLASKSTYPSSTRLRYPSSHHVSFGWEHDDSEDSVFRSLVSALNETARRSVEHASELFRRLQEVELDETQALVAEAMASAPDLWASTAVDFLLADQRRFSLGHASFDDDRGVTHTVQGYATKQLIQGIVPHLRSTQLASLKVAIWGWDIYSEARKDDDVRTRLRRLKWTEEARFELLELLPAELFEPRTLRQIKEWRATEPRLSTRKRPTAYSVGAPMSVSQMAKATDNALMGLLDECEDGTEWGRHSQRRRHITRSGGAIQVGRTLAELAKRDPDRVLNLLKYNLSAARHQYAAGSVVQVLGDHEEADPDDLKVVIHQLSREGFEGESWRRDAAWSLEHIAQRAAGLANNDLALLESWVKDSEEDSTRACKGGLESASAADQEKRPQAVIFGYGGVGGSLPQGNFPFLSAIAAGYLHRESPDCDGWLSVLERHVARSETLEVWSALLAFRGYLLFWADRARTHALISELWKLYPDAFDLAAGKNLWRYRDIIPADVQLGMLNRWRGKKDREHRQASGEFAVASALLGDNDSAMRGFCEEVMTSGSSPERLGGLFAAAAVWRQNGGAVRKRASHLLMRFAPRASGDDAEAISSALDAHRTLQPDAPTRQMLEAVLENPDLLAASLNMRFADALQELLLHPGFDDVVLRVSEAAVASLFEDPGNRGPGMVDGDYVAIAVALQRSTGAKRARAMDLYERLLDAEAYGATEAAAAALRN